MYVACGCKCQNKKIKKKIKIKKLSIAWVLALNNRLQHRYLTLRSPLSAVLRHSPLGKPKLIFHSRSQQAETRRFALGEWFLKVIYKKKPKEDGFLEVFLEVFAGFERFSDVLDGFWRLLIYLLRFLEDCFWWFVCSFPSKETKHPFKGAGIRSSSSPSSNKYIAIFPKISPPISAAPHLPTLHQLRPLRGLQGFSSMDEVLFLHRQALASGWWWLQQRRSLRDVLPF